MGADGAHCLMPVSESGLSIGKVTVLKLTTLLRT